MKANSSRFARSGALLAVAALAGCTAKQERAPLPAPTARPVIRPVALPAPPPRDWRDAAQTPGTWSWAVIDGGSSASFGPPGAASLVTFSCARGAGTVVLTRYTAAIVQSGPMAIYTTYGDRNVAATAAGGSAAVSFAARDPFLDAIAFSRGRFAIMMAGTAPLYLPSWPELGRVLQDCR